MKILVTIAFFCLASGIFAQTLSFNQRELLRISNTASGVAKSNFDSQYMDVTGSAFYNEQWHSGQAVMTTGKTYNGLYIKVDLYKNKFYINQNDTIYDITDVPQLAKIIVSTSADTNSKATFFPHFLLNGKSQLVQILSEGKITLIKQDNHDLQEVQTGVNTAKEKVFNQKTKYYLIKDNITNEVKLSKKNLEKSFSSEDWATITSYANSKNLFLNNENDVANAVNYLNSL